jgi:hypothetical protein|tara:strand:+ start:106 stop:408 length:303 start_codon:yes stop_codon:yes gene_type:complete
MNWETILKREISSFTASSYENRRKFIIISEVIPNEISVFWGYGDENYPKYDEEIVVFRNKDRNYVKNWLKNWLSKKGPLYNNMLLIFLDKYAQKTKERLQ